MHNYPHLSLESVRLSKNNTNISTTVPKRKLVDYTKEGKQLHVLSSGQKVRRRGGFASSFVMHSTSVPERYSSFLLRRVSSNPEMTTKKHDRNALSDDEPSNAAVGGFLPCNENQRSTVSEGSTIVAEDDDQPIHFFLKIPPLERRASPQSDLRERFPTASRFAVKKRSFVAVALSEGNRESQRPRAMLERYLTMSRMIPENIYERSASVR